MTKPTIQQIFQEKKTAFEAFGFSILGDEDAAKEVVQNVFVKLLEKAKWETLEKPIPYLLSSIKNEALQYLRYQKKWVDVEAYPPGSSDQDNTLEELSVQFEQIQKQLDLLPKQCRIIMGLKIKEGLTHAEISDYLNISEKTIENQVSIAFKKIRAGLKKSTLFLGVHLIIFILFIA